MAPNLIARSVGVSFSEHCARDLGEESDRDIHSLEPGKTIEREIGGTETHLYRIALLAGQFVRVLVEQKGIDVKLIVYGPGSKKMFVVDSPSGSKGQESAVLIAQEPGDYLIAVEPFSSEAAAARYTVAIDQLRMATPHDKHVVAAVEAVLAGQRFEEERSADSSRRAILEYRRALDLWRLAGDPVGEADTLQLIGANYSHSGQFDEALTTFHQELKLRQSTNDRRSLAGTHSRIGWIYFFLGRHQKALESFAQAVELCRIEDDRPGLAEALLDAGGLYDLLGERQKAMEELEESLKLFRSLSDRSGLAKVLLRIGSIFDSLWEKEKAIAFFDEAVTYFKELGDPGGQAQCYNSMGDVLASLGDHKKALHLYNEAFRLWRNTPDRKGRALALNGIGKSHGALGNRREALENLNQALDLFRAAKDTFREALVLYNIGKVHYSMGENQEALEVFEQALGQWQGMNDPAHEASALNSLGRVEFAMGHDDRALEFFAKALTLKRNLGERSGEAVVLADIARVERHLGRIVESRAHIESALSIVELLRTRISSGDLRSSYFASVQQYYEFYIDLLMQMHKAHPAEGFDRLALLASERARARSHIDSLLEAGADIRQGVDPSMLQRERLLEQRLNAKTERYLRLISRKSAAQDVADAKKEIEELTSEYEKVETQIRANSPRYAALTQPVPLDLQRIQSEVLDPNTLMLEYSLGEERSYVFAATSRSFVSLELPKRSEIEGASEAIYKLITARNQKVRFETPAERRTRIAKADAEYPMVAARLSQMLLDPVAALLGSRRLLIVSDGALQYLPFQMLPAPGTSRKNAREARPLIFDHEVVCLPSASTLAVLRRELADRKPATKTLAVLADPVFEKNDERVQPGGRSAAERGNPGTSGKAAMSHLEDSLSRSIRETGILEQGGGIPRLLSTRREANAIASLVAEEDRLEALDFQASRATATSPELGQYRFVHFASHGLLNSEHPNLSGIVLTLVDQHGVEQPGFLQAYEVYNLKLGADMVALSGCQTGLGKDVRGEGLVGLTRGFMYAGAARVMVSLWNVNDNATAELMIRFYGNMLGPRRLSTAAALRAAEISMLKEGKWRSPYFWAAFVLQGEPN
ncbi:MAG TPA: CHAT domain-containing tetratricopeptide repeat protein [Blastocatellia bacterium]|nr:CHAT domain-containing tetratricopeptide repeat protein [Blastocatellia bacterium]